MHLVMKCQAMSVEFRRQRLLEECAQRYSKVLGKEWGDEAKRKVAQVGAKRDFGAKVIVKSANSRFNAKGSPRSDSTATTAQNLEKLVTDEVVDSRAAISVIFS